MNKDKIREQAKASIDLFESALDESFIKLKEEAMSSFESKIDDMTKEEVEEDEFELPIFLRSYKNYTSSFMITKVGYYQDIFIIKDHFFSKKTYAQLKLQYIADKLNDGWVPDWDDRDEYKYYIAYSHHSNEIVILHNTIVYEFKTYFKSELLAKQAIKIMGSDMDYLRSDK
jgi:hypothetical protein